MKKLTIRLSEKTNDALGRLAQAHQRSVNKQVVWLIERAIRDDEKTPELTPDEPVKSSVKNDKSVPDAK